MNFAQKPDDMPSVIPVFPLPGALLLPRGQMPLNVFEPRYLAMIDDALRAHRVIGMIQPAIESAAAKPSLAAIGCAGRISQFAESGDGRYILTLTGVSRFRVAEEMEATTPYRQCRVDFDDFATDFDPRAGEADVDRPGVMRALREFAKANGLKIDWKGIEDAPNEALVNALSMMSPFGPKEKQALLEAKDLKSRADVLIAITEFDLVRGTGPHSSLQ